MFARLLLITTAVLAAALTLPTCEAGEPAPERKRLIIIGQDLGAPCESGDWGDSRWRSMDGAECTDNTTRR